MQCQLCARQIADGGLQFVIEIREDVTYYEHPVRLYVCLACADQTSEKLLAQAQSL